jgi:AcrR family transcriptional regulator
MAKPVGRPRNDHIRDDLMRAAEALVMEKGLAGLSIEAVATRAGTTRPSFYRRFDGLPELVLGVIQKRSAPALEEEIDTGSLRGDLEAIQRERVALLNDPLISRCLAGFLDFLPADEKLQHLFTERFLGPRRSATAAVLQRAKARGEISSSPDVEWIYDLLLGPLVLRTMMPGLLPLDEDLVAHSVASAMAALDAPGPAPGATRRR